MPVEREIKQKDIAAQLEMTISDLWPEEAHRTAA